MKVVYIERCLAENSLVFDQIQRISKHIETWTIAVQVGGYPEFKHPNVTSVPCPFVPKIERVKSGFFIRAARQAYSELYQPSSGFQKRLRNSCVNSPVVFEKLTSCSLKTHLNADIIHAHFAYPEGLAACRIAAKQDVPYIITARGDDLYLYPDRNQFLANAVKTVLVNAAAVIGVSRAICDEARRLGAAPNRCHTVPDGLKEDVFKLPAAASAPGESEKTSKTVLFAGAFLPVKNVEKMMEAFVIIHRHDENIRFLLAGEGPLAANLKRQAEQAGIRNACEFLGQLTHQELAKAMQKATVLCLPSISESWGHVIAESMACGTPVVGANVGGIPEQITSDDYGYLCDPHSPDDIAGKLLAGMNRSWDREKLSEHGRRFTRDDAAAKIIDIYETVLT